MQLREDIKTRVNKWVYRRMKHKHWGLSTILKTSKKVYEVMFFLICKRIYILRVYSMHYILCDKANVKKIPPDKVNVTQDALLISLASSTYHSFTLNSRYLYELKHQACHSKSMRGIFHLLFRFFFIKVYVFVQQKAWAFWL